MKILEKFDNIKLSVKIPMMIVMSCLVALILVLVQMAREISAMLIEEYKIEMAANVHGHKLQYQQIFDNAIKDLRVFSEDEDTLVAFHELNAAWNAMGNSQVPKIQKYYVNDNPMPVEKRHEFMGDDWSDYGIKHRFHNKKLNDLVSEYGYYDIFLINNNGDIIYSAAKESDFATNLNTGPWKDTDLAKAFREVKGVPTKGDSSFDFKPFRSYGPSNGAAASFIAKTLYDGSGPIGVVAIQLPTDLNKYIEDSTNMREYDDKYLVNSDGLAISKMHHDQDSFMKRNIGNLPHVQKALAGEVGEMISQDYEGYGAIAAYTHVDVLGDKIAIVMEKELNEVYNGIYEIIFEIALQSIIVCSILAILGYILSKHLVNSINKVSSMIGKLAQNQTDFAVEYEDNKSEIGDMARAISVLKNAVEENLLLQLMTSDYPVVRCDASMRVTFLNDAAKLLLKQLKFDHERIMNQPLSSLNEQFASNQSIYTSASKMPHTETLQFGSEWVSCTAHIIENKNGSFDGVYLNIKIVTAEVESEKSVLLAQESINELITAANSGVLTKRIDSSKFNGFYKHLADGINSLMETVEVPITKTVAALTKFADGNLDSKIDGNFSGAFLDMQNALNNTSARLAEIVSSLKVAFSTAFSAAKEISSGSTDLSMRTEQQASSLEETSASMEELTKSVLENTKNAVEANSISGSARKFAERGGNDVQNVISAMDGIEKSSQKISDIISVIDEIAFQTNLLALNAAVEAARAGEAGRGFAVVAQEVRSLAGRSASASKEIKELIDESSVQVKSGVDLVSESSKTLNEIIASVKKVADLVDGITEASKAQSTGLSEINVAVSQMDEMTQQNAALVEENNAAINALMGQIKKVEEQINFFHSENDRQLIASDVDYRSTAEHKSSNESFKSAKKIMSPLKPKDSDGADFAKASSRADKSQNSSEMAGAVEKNTVKASAKTKYDNGWEEF